jgi:hypothetical protein
MGRSLSWYIISINIEHDKTKEICLDLEFEPESDDLDLKSRFFNLIHPESKIPDREDYQDTRDFFKARSEYYKNINSTWHSYEHNNKICPKCKMYKSGHFHSEFVIDEYDVSHSYSNSIWRSEWSIRNFHMGSRSTNFIRRFSNEHMYSEVSYDDINSVYKSIERLGTPIRTSDIEAKEEVIRVLEFLSKYANRDDVYIIFIDEY